MIILVCVTINIALKGDLFESAETATAETEKSAILEQINEMAKRTDNGEINVDETINDLKDKYPNAVVYDDKTKKLTVVGKKGTYEYRVTNYVIELYGYYQFKIKNYVSNSQVNKETDSRGNTTCYYSMSIEKFCSLMNMNEDELENYIVYADEGNGIVMAEFGNGGVNAGAGLLFVLFSLFGDKSEEEIKELNSELGLPTSEEESLSAKFGYIIICENNEVKVRLSKINEIDGSLDLDETYAEGEIPDEVLNSTIKLKSSEAVKEALNNLNTGN